MKRLLLTRYLDDNNGTIGMLRLGRHRVCWIIEPPERDNRKQHSRIPTGEYRVNYIKKSASGRYRDVYHVTEVPGRQGILIHKGNYAGDRERGYCSDTYGCLMPADQLGVLACVNGEQRVGLDSAKGIRQLHAATDRENFILEVRNA